MSTTASLLWKTVLMPFRLIIAVANFLRAILIIAVCAVLVALAAFVFYMPFQLYVREQIILRLGF